MKFTLKHRKDGRPHYVARIKIYHPYLTHSGGDRSSLGVLRVEVLPKSETLYDVITGEVREWSFWTARLLIMDQRGLWRWKVNLPWAYPSAEEVLRWVGTAERLIMALKPGFENISELLGAVLLWDPKDVRPLAVKKNPVDPSTAAMDRLLQEDDLV